MEIAPSHSPSSPDNESTWNRIVNWYERWKAAGLTDGGAQPNLEAASGPPVLLAISDDLAAGLVAALLTQAGYRTIHARSGSEVLKMARCHVPRLMILDLHTSRRAALEILQLLGRDPMCKSVRVLVLALERLPAVETRVRAAGADEYLQRPFAPLDLMAHVGRLVALPQAA